MKGLIIELAFHSNLRNNRIQILHTVCYKVPGEDILAAALRKTSGLNLLASDVIRRLEIQAEKLFYEGCWHWTWTEEISVDAGQTIWHETVNYNKW